MGSKAEEIRESVKRLLSDYKGEYVVVSIRLPRSWIVALDTLKPILRINRTELIRLCIREYILSNLDRILQEWERRQS